MSRIIWHILNRFGILLRRFSTSYIGLSFRRRILRGELLFAHKFKHIFVYRNLQIIN